MPVFVCHCGAEVRISPGQMLALGHGGFVCPECGERPVATDQAADIEPSSDLSLDEDSDIVFAEFASSSEPEPIAEQSDDPESAEFETDKAGVSAYGTYDSADGSTDEASDETDEPVDHHAAEETAAPDIPAWRVDESPQAQGSNRNWTRHLAAAGTSLVVHAILLLLLAVFVVTPILKRDAEIIDVYVDAPGPDLGELDISEDLRSTGAVTIGQGADAPTSTVVGTAMAATSQAPPSLELQVATVTPRQVQVPMMSSSSLLTPVPTVRRSEANRGGLVQGQTSGHATQGVLDAIGKEAAGGRVQVVWLMDASISMNVDRQEVANRLVPFYKEMAQRDKKEAPPLLSSVVTFGAQTVELVSTTRNIEYIIKAVAALQDDPSGLENVMTAVQFCVRKYSSKKHTLIVVVFTDESGDDILKLEETIHLCRTSNTIVHIVGPNAVFGSERGTHLWRDADSGFAFRLPVKRGPETSLPERMMLPYWHGMRFPTATMKGNMVAQDLPWYGGPLREGLLSGFGPYALTRLSLQTGGTFTVLGRPGDTTIASLEQLRPYLPDYSSAREYYSEVQSSPLRRAVSESSTLIWQSPELTAPPRTFLFSRQTFYPFDAFVDYLNPENFRKGFRDNLQTALKGSRAEMEIMERALAIYEAENLEPEYEKETSLRWKAWYDLNYGRLLANMVRHVEYQLTCEQILASGALNPETNHVTFIPSTQYKGGRVSAGRAVQARRLLERCRKNNPGTQWDKLAEWELEFDLGMGVQQIVLQPPRPGPMVPMVPIPPTRPISFPRL